MEKIKLCDLKNLSSEKIDFITLHFLLLIESEYLLSYLGYTSEGNDFYWTIRDYLGGVITPNILIIKINKCAELNKLSRNLPSFTAKGFKSKEELSAFLETSTWEYKEGISSFSFKGETFAWKAIFLKPVIKDSRIYYACYEEDDEGNTNWHLKTNGNDEIVETALPYPFTKKAIPTKNEDESTHITEEEFFGCEDLARLDEDQKKAVTSPIETNSVILAGAGSGKTRCIVARVAYLNLVKGIPLRQIVLMTFTRNAASELKSRIEKLYLNLSQKFGVQLDCNQLSCKTIDSFVYQIAHIYYREMSMRREPRYSTDVGDKNKIASICDSIIQQEQMKDSVYSWYYRNGNLDPHIVDDLEKFFNGMPMSHSGIEALANEYLNWEITRTEFFDFSSLTYLFFLIMNIENSSLAKAIASDYKAILIDEFQDVSIIQNQSLKPLYNGRIHFTFVGDDDQTIYGWRGSDIQVFKEIETLPNSKVYSLTMNYRSNVSIVRAGNGILKVILNRAKARECRALDDTPTPITVATYDDKFSQLIPEIDSLHDAGVNYNKILILARTRAEVIQVQNALNAHNTPTLTNSEKLVLGDAYRLMMAMIKINLGEAPIGLADQIKFAFDLQGDQYTEKYIQSLALGKIAGKNDQERKVYLLGSALRNQDDHTLVDVATRYANVYHQVTQDYSNESLFDAFENIATNMKVDWPCTSDQFEFFCKNFESQSVQSEKTTSQMDGVKISTIHSAKGLEADYVFVLGLAAGKMPNVDNILKTRNALKAQLLDINQSRDKLKELKKNVNPTMVDDAISECDYSARNSFEKNCLSSFKKQLMNIRSELARLSANGAANYHEYYSTYIYSITLNMEKEERKIRKELAQENDELLSLQQKDAENNYVSTGDSTRYDQIHTNIENSEKKLKELSIAKSTFDLGTRTITKLYQICCKAESYSTDIANEKDLQQVEALLDKTEEELKNEERRLFYVAVTRASKKLYLMYPEGEKESEFISLIPNDLLRRENLLSYKEKEQTRTEIKEVKDRTWEKETEEIPDEEVEISIENENIKAKLQAFLDAYYESHPICRKLVGKARNHFECAVRWDCLGKISGDEGAEYIVAVCLEKSAVELIQERVIGESSFVTSSISCDYSESKRIAQDISKMPFRFGSPSENYIVTTLNGKKHTGVEPLNNIKGLGIALWARFSGRYISIRTNEKWQSPSCGQKNIKILTINCVDLGNCRNDVVHHDESQWNERTLGILFDTYLEILDLLI